MGVRHGLQKQENNHGFPSAAQPQPRKAKAVLATDETRINTDKCQTVPSHKLLDRLQLTAPNFRRSLSCKKFAQGAKNLIISSTDNTDERKLCLHFSSVLSVKSVVFFLVFANHVVHPSRFRD